MNEHDTLGLIILGISVAGFLAMGVIFSNNPISRSMFRESKENVKNE